MNYGRQSLTIIFTIFIALFALSSVADNACRTISQPYEREYCYSKLLSSSDQELTRVYQKLRQCLNPKDKRNLIHSQLKWLSKRQSACSSKKMIDAACNTNFNLNRTDFLSKRLSECNEFDNDDVVVGEKYAFKSDNGLFLARCSGCNRSFPGYTESVTVHVPDPNASYAQFRVVGNTNGTVALQADTGKYIAHIDDAENLMIYAEDSNDPNAQWLMINITNGKIAFKDNNNHYLCRCNNCAQSTESNVADSHCTSSKDPWAQWTPTYIQ